MKKEQNRDQTIDAFRGVAIISVMAFHYLVRWEVPMSAASMTGLTQSYPSWIALGRLGVELFFVISGLVITMTILRSKDVIEFAAKRFSRLYPPFIVSVFLTAGVLLIYDPAGFSVSPRDFVANLTMLPTALNAKPVDGAYWSLLPEIFFYGWVALSWFFLKDRFWIGIVILGILGAGAGLVSSALRVIMLADHIAFFLGGVALWFWIKKNDRTAAVIFAAAAILYVTNAYRLPPTGAPAWVMHTYLLTGIAMLALLMKFLPGAQWGPLAWVGRISYSLYLVHQNLGVTLIHALKAAGLSDILAIGITVTTMVLLAWLMFNFVELRGQRLAMSAYEAVRGRISGSPVWTRP